MKEMFTNAMVVCTAVATFGGSAVLIANSVLTLVDSRVDTVVQTKYTAPAEAADSSTAGALVQQTGKLLKLLK
jgi:hypothetical protein